MGIPYDALTLHQQQTFELEKDELHENLFGHIERLKDAQHAVVPGDDPLTLRVFRDGLVKIFKRIVTEKHVAGGRRGTRPQELWRLLALSFATSISPNLRRFSAIVRAGYHFRGLTRI